MTTLTWDRHRGHSSSYDVLVPGFNYRLDEVRAAVGVVQLARLPDENAARARSSPATAMRSTTEWRCPSPTVSVTPSHHLAVVLLPEGPTGRRPRRARRAGIQTSVHYPPIHAFTAYRDPSRRPLPCTQSVAEPHPDPPALRRNGGEQVEAVVERLLQTL